MADVFRPKVVPDKHQSYEDHQTNIQNFILLELKKLAGKMMDTGLCNSLLEYEIARIEALILDGEKFSKKMNSLFYKMEKVEKSLNEMNSTLNASLFFSQKEIIKARSPQEATEWFKRLHVDIEEEGSAFSEVQASK
jgi:hypothetical protein